LSIDFEYAMVASPEEPTARFTMTRSYFKTLYNGLNLQ